MQGGCFSFRITHFWQRVLMYTLTILISMIKITIIANFWWWNLWSKSSLSGAAAKFTTPQYQTFTGSSWWNKFTHFPQPHNTKFTQDPYWQKPQFPWKLASTRYLEARLAQIYIYLLHTTINTEPQFRTTKNCWKQVRGSIFTWKYEYEILYPLHTTLQYQTFQSRNFYKISMKASMRYLEPGQCPATKAAAGHSILDLRQLPYLRDLQIQIQIQTHVQIQIQIWTFFTFHKFQLHESCEGRAKLIFFIFNPDPGLVVWSVTTMYLLPTYSSLMWPWSWCVKILACPMIPNDPKWPVVTDHSPWSLTKWCQVSFSIFSCLSRVVSG